MIVLTDIQLPFMPKSPSSHPQKVCFGPFAADFHTQELRKNGIRVRVPGQSLHVLEILLDRPGELVTREELRAALWPSDTFVDFENGLNATVKRLRDALNDSPETPRFIETLPRRGYRFIAEVHVENPTSKLKSAVSRPHLKMACVVGLALVVLAFGAYRQLVSGSESTINTIAVLPFSDATSDPNTDYLSQGITDGLIGSLSRLPNLIVRPLDDVVRHKSSQADLQKVGRELQVSTIVTGRILQRGDSVIVTVELIDMRRNRTLWSERYETKLSDTLIVQKEISQEVATRLLSRLTSEQKRTLTNNGTNDPRAYELYLKGHYQWGKRTLESLSKAKDYYEQAVQEDPNYAPAYVGLAEYFLALPSYAYASIGSTNPDAKANALRALEIDESLPQAHAILATVYDNDWDPAAAREYQRALELNPNDAYVHVLYGIYLSIRGDQEQSFLHLRRALELDPLDLNASENVAYTYYYSRQYGRAIEQLKSLLQLEPNYASAHEVLAGIYRFMGKYDLWLDEWEESARLSNDAESLQLVKTVRSEYLKSNYRSATKRLIALREEQSKHLYVDPGLIALDYATLADKEQTFIWLEKAFAEKSAALSFGIKVDPNFDFIRSDPRYANLLHRMNLS
jgi:TolB-like protein/DNA-binding winged helix-turn-helix (wHTH) protein/Tfp pilus assembly protein PilF